MYWKWEHLVNERQVYYHPYYFSHVQTHTSSTNLLVKRNAQIQKIVKITKISNEMNTSKYMLFDSKP